MARGSSVLQSTYAHTDTTGPTVQDEEGLDSQVVNSVGLGDRRGCDECKELLDSEQWLAL
jgi:hypothetical protein